MTDRPGEYDGPPLPAPPTVPGVEVTGRAGEPGEPGEPPSWAGVDLLTGASVTVRVLSAPADAAELDSARDQDERMTLVRPVTLRDHVIRRHVVDLADGTSALVSDTVEGTSLADVLARRGALTPGETVTVLVPLLQILDDLHAAGAALGGVEPGQLLVTADGRPVFAGMGPLQESADSRRAAAADVRAVGELAWRLLGGHSDSDDGLPRRRADVLARAGPLGPAVTDALQHDPMRRPRADELLDQLFAAQAPEPIGLEGPPPGRRGMPVTRSERRRQAASTARREGSLRRIVRRPRVSAWATTPVRWVRPGVVVVGAALVVGLVALTASRLWPDPSTSPATAAVTTSATTASATTTSGRPEDLRGARRAALRSSPSTVLQEVATARARALTNRSTALLGGADVPGSAAFDADERIIMTLTATGQRYAGLGFIVRTATLVTLEPDRVVISALVDRTAYDVVAPATSARTGPATATRHGPSSGPGLTYELALSSHGWRLVSVGTAPGRVSP